MDERLFVTIDVDWSHDDVLAFALDVLERERVPATVFVTHDSPILARLRASEGVEVGLHPNLNPLLEGRAGAGRSAADALDAARALVPEARCVRSHSLVQSSRLLDRCADLGFTHEANTFIPATAGIALAPWPHWRGDLVRVPYLFDDSLAGLIDGAWDVRPILENPGLKVANFHPGRLFLNQREAEMPDGAKAVRHDPPRLVGYRNGPDVAGSLTFLERLVEAHRGRGGTFGTLTEIRAPSHGRDDAGQPVRPTG